MSDLSENPFPASLSDEVRTEFKGGQLHIILHNTKRRNVLTTTTVAAITQALDAAVGRACAVIIESAGPDFCAGFDLSDADTISEGDLLLRFVHIEQLLARLWSAPFVTAAVARGRAFGAGADLFAACDIRLADASAEFCFPGSGFGVVLGVRRLCERVGRDVTRELHRTGRVIDAKQAEQFGLVTHFVDKGAPASSLVDALGHVARLDSVTRGVVHQLTSEQKLSLDTDLAELVRSVTRPGFRERLIAYRNSVLKARRKPD